MKRHPCVSCAELTRRTVRWPTQGEDHRVYLCSSCPMLDISEYLTPEARLLVAIYGGVSAFLGRAYTWYGDFWPLAPLPSRVTPEVPECGYFGERAPQLIEYPAQQV